MSGLQGPCPHSRPDWRMCPHCNGTNGNEIEPPDPASFDEGSGTLAEGHSEYWVLRHFMVEGKPVTEMERRKSSNNEVISVETVDGWPDGIVFGGVDD